MNTTRWLGRLFLTLTLLQLIPIWTVHYLPTSDGAAHLYNAWVLRQLLTGEAHGIVKDYYQINWQPNPNWFGHAFMAAAMGAVPPIVAEKLLFSATLLMFFTGLWFFTGANDERSRAYAFMAFPLAWHLLLQMGFYNFAFSLGLYLFIVGVWWNHRDRPDAETIGVTAALLIVCYFAHPMSTLLAIGSIGLMWLVTLQGRVLRRHALHLLAFLPVLPLLVWFACTSSTFVMPNTRPARWLFNYIAQAEVIMVFSVRQLDLGRVLFALTVVLFIATMIRENLVHSGGGRVWRFREADVFLLIYLVFIALYVQAPAETAGGGAVTERMALFVHLLPLAWFSGRLAPKFRGAIVVVMSIVAIGNAFFMTARYRHYDRVIRDFLRTTDPIASNSTVLSVMFDRAAEGTFVGVLSHAIGYKAIEKNLVDLGNYEPGMGYFPVLFRPDITHPNVGEIEGQPGGLSMATYAPQAQYVFTWAMPHDAAIAKRIALYYRLVSQSGLARVYRRLRDPVPRGSGEMILLPVAGTRGELGAPGGARWKVDQQVTNIGDTPVRVSLSTCAPGSPCELDLAPGQTENLATANEIVRFSIVRVLKGEAKKLSFRTVAHRVDEFRPDLHLELPAVHESAFRKGRIEIQNVPLNGTSRLNLRLWIIGPVPARQFTARLISAKDRRILAEQTFPIGTDAHWANGNLARAFPDVAGNVNIVIEPDPASHEAQVWGFITLTDNATEVQRIILPTSGTGF